MLGFFESHPFATVVLVIVIVEVWGTVKASARSLARRLWQRHKLV